MSSAYEDLTDAQIMHMAEHLHERPDVVAFHEYVQKVRDEIDGKAPIAIPQSHKKIFAGENREGAQRFNRRVNQLAAYLSRAALRFSLVSPSDDTDVAEAAARTERWIRNAEEMLARGTGVVNWKHATYRDAAECGVSIIQQMPRRGYYVEAKKNPQQMAKGALVKDVLFRRRVDPLTFAWDVRSDGTLGNTTLGTEKRGTEVLETMGDVAVTALAGLLAEPLDPAQPDTLQKGTFKLREVWWDNGYAVVLMSVQGRKLKGNALKKGNVGRIIHRGKNVTARPPFYIATAGPPPWAGPLDEMYALTGARNYWATMLDIQASGAIFRHWQLVDSNTGEDLTFTHPEASKLPEAVRYDPSEAPPDMGPGTEWKLAPFEFHDVTPRFEQIKFEHEDAGSSVARLMGQVVNQNTPVGTADAIDDMAQRELSMLIESIEDRTVEMWVDGLRWLREHGDPVQVYDTKRMPGATRGFISTVTSLKGSDVQTEHLRVRLDPRARLAIIADYRMFVEMEMHGHMDFDRGVEEGLIPFVDDADEEKSALFVSEVERLETTKRLREMSADEPRFLGGRETDRRGSGVGQGANNISNTAIDAGGADAARAIA